MKNVKMILLGTLLFGAFLFVEASAKEPVQTTTYQEVVSGRYWMMPRSAMLNAGMTNPNYVQVHWFLEVGGAKKRLSEPEKYDTSVRAYPEWEKVRKEVLAALVKENLLTSKPWGTGSAPKEIFDDREWSRTIKQALAYRHGFAIDWCKTQLVTRSLKSRVAGDLKWWVETVTPLSDNKCGN